MISIIDGQRFPIGLQRAEINDEPRFRANVPASCCVDRCQGQGCSVSLEDAPTPFVLINMDCPDIQIEDASKRCDYLFIGEGDTGGSGWKDALHKP